MKKAREYRTSLKIVAISVIAWLTQEHRDERAGLNEVRTRDKVGKRLAIKEKQNRMRVTNMSIECINQCRMLRRSCIQLASLDSIDSDHSSVNFFNLNDVALSLFLHEIVRFCYLFFFLIRTMFACENI